MHEGELSSYQGFLELIVLAMVLSMGDTLA